MKIDVLPGDHPQTDRACWAIQTHSDELTEPDVELLTNFGSSHEMFDV